jgi:hypothetical protein
MNQGSAKPFDSVESAQDFVALLSETVAEAKQEVDADVARELGLNSSRRVDALRIVSYSLEKLELHINKSRRILNDLRSLRRLLFEERTAKASQLKPKPVAIANTVAMPKPELPVTALAMRPAPPMGSGTKPPPLVAA